MKDKAEIIQRGVIDLLDLDKESLKRLSHRPGETIADWYERNAEFFTDLILDMALGAEDEKVKFQARQELKRTVTPINQVIDLTAKRSPIDAMTDKEALEWVVDKLLEEPAVRGMLEDRLREGADNKQEEES